MCGICGFVGNHFRSILESMTQVMAHRGPDDCGFYLDTHVGLGHRRLSIIDLHSGQQPIFNEDGSVIVVYNGEIYNFHSLRDDLLSKGHTFKSKTDTEVLVHLYEEYGTEFVSQLRGMFAFAIWDKRTRELFLVRDRFGIKPLYYTETAEGSFVFASEIKSLLEFPSIPREIDPIAFDQYFTFRYVPADRTMLRGIKKLEPGHSLVRKGRKTSIRQYWDLDFDRDEPFFDSEPALAERLTHSLRDAIKMRLISDVPLGAYLSGGLDSSFMVGLMSSLCPDPVNTFSIGFDDIRWNESHFSDIVAEFFHSKHHRLVAKANAIDILEKVIWHLDEPLADAATIPTFMMSELTRQFVTVVLSGEGADELLAGYDKYKILGLGHRLRNVTPSFLFDGFSPFPRTNVKIDRLFSFLSSLRDPAEAYLSLVSVFSAKEKDSLYSDPTLRSRSSYDLVRGMISKFKDPLHNFLYVDLKTWLPNDVLLKNDKMTMANSIEARVPFLDHKFAEETARIPVRLKMKGLREKYILREAMKPHVPECIVKRRKHGFTVPVRHWMDQGLEALSREVLSPRNIKRRGLLNPGYVLTLLQKNMDNVFYRRQFWTVLTFELWCQTFLDAYE